jgi:cellulose synthase/poly-beta-1,6-N-acetylglucosamine synthase-like glycosyltransferase
LNQNAPEADWYENPDVLPRISVVIPMYNEESHIADCLNALLKQDYPSELLEIHVVDGASQDNSSKVVWEEFVSIGVPVQLHHNPDRKIPHSLNIGLNAATGQVLVILGAHAEVEPDFLKYNVENLRRAGVACAGGTLVNAGRTETQRSIGAVMGHPFALASAPHRFRKRPGFTRTVAFGAYRMEIFDEIGKFEEHGEISEDAELNLRILQAGYKIYYDPRVRTVYYPRRSLRALFRQMATYGILRASMYRKHRHGLSWLHFLPPLALTLLIILGLAALVSGQARLILVAAVGLYGLVIFSAGLTLKMRRRGVRLITMLAAFVLIHFCWAAGFLSGLLRKKVDFRLLAGEVNG